MPALGRAREAAKSTVCKSNLRQIGIAWTNYLATSKGAGKPGNIFSLGAGKVQTWWYSSDSAASPQYNVEGGWLYPYHKNANIYDCPTIAGVIPASSIYPGLPPSGYGYNSWTKLPSRVTRVRRAAETVLFADSGQFSGTTLVRVAAIPAPSTSNLQNFHARHNKRGNVVWYDGHVTAEAPYLRTTGLPRGLPASAVLSARTGYLTPATDAGTDALLLARPDLDYYFWGNKETRDAQ